MRILYHHRTQGEEPESIHIDAIISALRSLGHDVRLVGPSPSRLEKNAQWQPSLLGGIKRWAPRFVFELLQIAYNALAYRRLGQAISEFKPDFVYERYALYSFAGVLISRQLGIPLILEVNTPYAQAWASYYGLYFQRIARSIERWTLCKADHIVTVTNVQRKMLEQAGIPGIQITVCHNAIDPKRFFPDHDREDFQRKSLGLSGIVVGFVGTMTRWQGIPEFPGVIKRVLNSSPAIQFLFVGDGEFRTDLERFCLTEGYSNRVVFTGRKTHEEIPGLLSVMDIAILLNSNEYGSPMKVFEYLGMHKAVIAPAVGPVLEILQDGVTGLLIVPGDANDMSKKILTLANNAKLRSDLGEAGYEYVLSNHTWLHNAKKILEIYSNLMIQRK